MRPKPLGKDQPDFSVGFSPEPVYPPTQPQQGLSPQVLEVGRGGTAPRVTGLMLPFSLRHGITTPPPPPHLLASSCWSSPQSPGRPVRRPSQAQPGFWFISAAPAASLSGLVNRGSRWGRRRGLLWAMSGFRALLVPVPIVSPEI